MNEDTLKSIEKKLDIIIKLLAGNLVKEKSKTESIIVLGGCGIDVSTIAELVGTTSGTVSVTLSKQKKKDSVAKKKKGKVEAAQE